MVRVLLTVLAITIVAGVSPSFAQGGGCNEWCRVNRCSGGMMSGNAPVCMNRCVAACQAKRQSKWYGHRSAGVSLRNSSGNFAKFAAIRRASSFVSNFADDRRPGSSS
jgi:hypothetical protein